MSAPDDQEDAVADSLDLRLWRRIFAYALRRRDLLLPLFVSALLVALADGSFAFLTRGVIDDVTLHGSRHLTTWIAAYVAATLVLSSGVWVFIRNAGGLANALAHDIRRDAFARLQSLEFAYYDARPVGWLLARLTADCDRLARIIAWGFLDIVWGLLLTLTIAGVLVVLHPQLAVLTLSVVPPLILLGYYFQKLLLRSSREVRRWNSQITATFNESIQGVRTTRTLAREAAALGEFRELSGSMFHVAYLNARQSAVYYPVVMGLGSVAGALALWRGGVLSAEGAISLGTLVAFISYAGQFFFPINQIARILAEMQGAQAAGERVLGLLDTQPAIRDAAEVQARVAAHPAAQTGAGALAPDGRPARIQTVEFADVTFAYARGKTVLRDFDLTVHRGQTIALVGPSGGGKTTLVSLVCRFYEPTSGIIRIDGVDYRERPLLWLQAQLGIVLQQPHLFTGTVRENIRYGRLDATDAEIEEAARQVEADGFIRALEKGYDTPVGEGGARLSAGQRQLISIARALLARPQILVMDEATSAVDTETEQAIQRGLARILEGRLCFIIAHRLSTIRRADRILFIQNGGIAESGTHAELIARRGLYHELYTSQYRREREEDVLEGRAE